MVESRSGNAIWGLEACSITPSLQYSTIPRAGDRFSSNSSFTLGKHQAFFPVGGEGHASEDILSSQIRKVAQDLLFAHSRSKVAQLVINRDAKTPDAGLA